MNLTMDCYEIMEAISSVLKFSLDLNSTELKFKYINPETNLMKSLQTVAYFEGKKGVFDKLTKKANLAFDIIPDNIQGAKNVKVQMVIVSDIASRLIDHVSNCRLSLLGEPN